MWEEVEVTAYCLATYPESDYCRLVPYSLSNQKAHMIGLDRVFTHTRPYKFYDKNVQLLTCNVYVEMT